MSIKAVSLRGRPMWQIQIWRDGGAFNRRRYLDRKRFLKADAQAIEAEMLEEYARTKEGTHHDEAIITTTTSTGRATATAVTLTAPPRAGVVAARTAATNVAVSTATTRTTTATRPTTATTSTRPTTATTSTASPTTPALSTTRPAMRSQRTAVSLERPAIAPAIPEPPPTPTHARPIPRVPAPIAAISAGMPTFAAFAERYLRVQDPTRSDFRNKSRDLRLHLVPILGDLPLDAIGRAEVDELKVRLRTPTGEGATSRRSLNRKDAPVSARRKGGTRSPKTINNILGTLRSVLGLALEYEIIDRLPRIRLEREDKKDPRFLDFGEADALIQATPPDQRALVLTLIRTGLRQGELQELRWRDVHLADARPSVRVSRSVRRVPGRGLEVKTTKSRRPRSVPLCADVKAALAVLRGRAADDDLVFHGDDGGYLDGDRLRRLLADAARDAQLDKHVHPHMLRHTFASHCTMRGVPPQVIQKWLGHASVTTTQRYAHLRPDTGDDLIDLLVSPGGSAQADVLKITNNTTNNKDPLNARTPSTGR